MTDHLSTRSARSVGLVDALLVLWVAGWIVAGIVAGIQVRGLARFSDTLDRAARAVDETGTALQPLQQIPFVGNRVGTVVARVHAAARSARSSAAASRGSVNVLSWLLTFSIALAPTVPLVALYVSIRAARFREAQG